MLTGNPLRLGATVLGLLIFVLVGCAKFPEFKRKTFATPEAEEKAYHLLGSYGPPLAFHSASTASTHRIQIYLPPGYLHSGRRYPVLYLTDAQWAFDFYAETLDWKHKEVVLIGIEQESTYRRFIDFTPLGAEAYLRFLKRELIPMLETKLRINQDRTFMGVSLGALFGGILLTDEPVGTPFFKNYLLVDGTFNFLTSKYLEAESARFKASHEFNLQIILTGATPGNSSRASAFADRYRQRGYQGLNVIFKAYSIPHESVAAPSFSDFIDVIYPAN